MTRRKRSFNDPNEERDTRRSNVIQPPSSDDEKEEEIDDLSTEDDEDTEEIDDTEEIEEVDEDDYEDESSSENADQMDEEMDENIERVYLNSDGEEFTAEEVDQLPSASVSASASEANSLANSAYFPPLSPHWSEIFTSNEMQNLANTMSEIANELMHNIPQLPPSLPNDIEPQVDLQLLFPSNMSSTGPPALNLTIETLSLLSPQSPTININRYPMASRIPVRRRRTTRGFRIDSVPMSTFTFTDDEYQMATHYFLGLLWNEDNDRSIVPSINVLHIILEYWEINERNVMPTFEEITELILSEITMVYNINTPIDEARNIIGSWLENYGYAPAAVDIDQIYEFYLLHHDYPTEEQLEESIIRALRFFTNPEAYHQEDKIHVPALNVDKIPKVENQENELVCSICQEEIEQGQMLIKLPPCNHAFHASPKQCLDGLSIFTWLGQHNMCPLCKTKVSVEI